MIARAERKESMALAIRKSDKMAQERRQFPAELFELFGQSRTAIRRAASAASPSLVAAALYPLTSGRTGDGRRELSRSALPKEGDRPLTHCDLKAGFRHPVGSQSPFWGKACRDLNGMSGKRTGQKSYIRSSPTTLGVQLRPSNKTGKISRGGESRFATRALQIWDSPRPFC